MVPARPGPPHAHPPVRAAADDPAAVGRHRHPQDGPVVSLEGQQVLARVRIPDDQGLVLASTDDPVAIGAEPQAGDGVGVPLEREKVLSRFRVPQTARFGPRRR